MSKTVRQSMCSLTRTHSPTEIASSINWNIGSEKAVISLCFKIQRIDKLWVSKVEKRVLVIEYCE